MGNDGIYWNLFPRATICAGNPDVDGGCQKCQDDDADGAARWSRWFTGWVLQDGVDSGFYGTMEMDGGRGGVARNFFLSGRGGASRGQGRFYAFSLFAFFFALFAPLSARSAPRASGYPVSPVSFQFQRD